jgi:hypothetical protein
MNDEEKCKRFLYPKKDIPTEFEVQAELYCKLKKLGFQVRGDVRREGCQFDLVIYDNDLNAKCIVEVKNWDQKDVKRKKDKVISGEKKQINKYKKFGITILMCYNQNYIDKIIKYLSEKIDIK